MEGLRTFFQSWLLRSLIVVAVTLGGFWYILQIVTDTQNASIDRLSDHLNASLSEVRADIRGLKDGSGKLVGIADLEDKIDRNFEATTENRAVAKVVADRVQDVREDLALQLKLLGQQVERIDPSSGKSIQQQSMLYSASLERLRETTNDQILQNQISPEVHAVPGLLSAQSNGSRFDGGLADDSNEKRLALVIGNQNYRSVASLKNPVNDARAISDELERLGFDVALGIDLDFDALRGLVHDFARKSRDADLTLFYYAGHGIAVDGENYLIPIDAKLDHPEDLDFETYSVADILRLIGASPGPSLYFLDACRDNPFLDNLALAQVSTTRSLRNRGLSRIQIPTSGTGGTLIGYATEPGQIAADGAGQNSPFALALLEHLRTENTDIASLTSRITRDVIQMTQNAQRPRFDVSLSQPVILNNVQKPVMAVAQSLTDATGKFEIEKFMFEAAMASRDKADYEAFLVAFPESIFAELARNAIARIEDGAMEEGVFAALSPDEETVGQTIKRALEGSVDLRLTPTVRSLPSSIATEQTLALDRRERKEIQLRLNLSGYDVGLPDGIIGAKSRRAISTWQRNEGFPSTGYLNSIQYGVLLVLTEQQFRAYIDQNPDFLTGTNPTKPDRPTVSNKDDFITDFLKGVGAGVAVNQKKQ